MGIFRFLSSPEGFHVLQMLSFLRRFISSLDRSRSKGCFRLRRSFLLAIPFLLVVAMLLLPGITSQVHAATLTGTVRAVRWL